MCDGSEIMGISTQSPIYAELEGKRDGDAISFNGRELVIEAVAWQLRHPKVASGVRYNARRPSRHRVGCLEGSG